jgi:dTDP-4-dehydrorhamnose reductase
MKILILGGSGMLGHRLWMSLSRYHETWVTVRGDASETPRLPGMPDPKFIRPHVDALNFTEVTRAFASIEPDLVINCIGLIKQQGHIAKDPVFSISINALLPHRISMLCKVAKARMIHISTDCIFSGKKGNYIEPDQSDAEDLYGRTKFLGEVAYPHTITLRTSIIGRELKSKLGLIEWFLAQEGAIKGYTNAIYTGFTTGEFSRIISDYVIPHPELTGVYHVSSNAISKCDLLEIVKQYFHKNITIEPDNDFFCDRSLNSQRFRNDANYCPPSWDQMIREMADGSSNYDSIG